MFLVLKNLRALIIAVLLGTIASSHAYGNDFLSLCLKTRIEEVTAEERPVARDQCKVGNCWLAATLGAYDLAVESTSGRKISLSLPFLYSRYLRAQTQAYLSEIAAGTPASHFQIEGASAISLSSIDMAVPMGTWSPRTPYEQWPDMVKKITFQLESYKLTAKQPDAYAKTRSQIDKILDEYIGEPPQKVLFDGKTYTPTEFKNWLSSQVRIKRLFVNPYPGAISIQPNSFFKPSNETSDYVKAPEDALPILERALEQRIPTVVSLYWVEQLTARHYGYAIAAGRSPSKLRSLRKQTRISHAMLFIGLERDVSGKVVGLKFQNSWGNTSSVPTMTVDVEYFKHFIQDIHFFLKPDSSGSP